MEAAARKSVSERQAQATIKAIIVAPAASPATEGNGQHLADNISQALKGLSIAKMLGPQMLLFAAGMGMPSNLGNDELPASVVAAQLNQLDIPLQLDLSHLANVNGRANVSYRIVMDGANELKPKWVPTDGSTLSADVRVRNVRYNSESNTYEFIRDGDFEPALIWTPIVQPGNSSTSTPARPSAPPSIPGFPALPVLPELEVYPEELEEPDDYILIFPSESGWENQYVMFRNPRKIPGVASGYGQSITGNWLGGKTAMGGVPIPSQIADQLRGRNFSSFDKQREAIWKAVAGDLDLSMSFDATDLAQIQKGNAPFVMPSEGMGLRTRYEIHHIDQIQHGGEVYDMDNFSIMTPREHINMHRKDNNHDI